MPRILVLLLVSLLVSAGSLDSKDVKERLEAVGEILEKGGPDAEAQLLRALKDRDWEVVHRAAEALGKGGSTDAVEPLLELALRGPVRRIRRAAAVSLRSLHPERAADLLAKRIKGPTTQSALDALAILAHPAGVKGLENALRKTDSLVVAGALRALGSLKDPERVDEFTEFLEHVDIQVRAAAVEALVASGSPRAVGALRDGLKPPSMTAVMERRHIAGIRTLLLGLKDEKKRDFAAQMCARTLGMVGVPKSDARYARLLGSLGRKEAPVGPVDDYLTALTGAGLSSSAVAVRRATVHALGRIGRDDTYEKVAAFASNDSAPTVRFHALRAAVTIRGAEALGLVLNRLRYDEEIMVREEAATIAGKLRKVDAVPSLIRSLNDQAWEVQVCAAVSLGKLRDAKGVDPLIALAEHKDWRVRGGALTGLGWIKSKKAVPVLLEAVRDREPVIAATAVEFLRHISGKPLEATAKNCHDWWNKHGPRFAFRDPDQEAKEKKKYGYAVRPKDVYEDLDVIVLQTRRGGDNIQVLLKEYGITHRIIRAASLKKAGIHPYALFVANCPGEIVPDDVAQLQWFVRVGGYLFASCWALTETVQRAFPDVVQKLPLKGQVIGTVHAEPCPVESPFLEGVFDGVTEPLYELEGSHLIDLLDPERFEVLIDSPETAGIWGEGNLAGWFTVGHGVILDSANHFDLQGMRKARVRNEKERMAFAVDHLGYDYETLRQLKAEGVFAKGPTADKRTRDLSTFRFITTFVRQKRLADEE